MANNNTLQKGHVDVSIYKGNTYRFLHKFKGWIEGIVTYKKDKDPQISILPTGEGGMAKSMEVFINLGLVSKIEQI